jgi:hypothetical protein
MKGSDYAGLLEIQEFYEKLQKIIDEKRKELQELEEKMSKEIVFSVSVYNEKQGARAYHSILEEAIRDALDKIKNVMDVGPDNCVVFLRIGELHILLEKKLFIEIFAGILNERKEAMANDSRIPYKPSDREGSR